MTADTAVLEHTTSPDGTSIGFWRSGRGPALVLVHGATADHRRWETVLHLLEPHATCIAVDRRGRGASGDTEDYSIDREAADLTAVVEAVAAGEGGRPVDVVGHSYGALCALEASRLTTRIRRLVLYEAGVGVLTPPEFAERTAELVAQGRLEEALHAMLTFIGVPEEQVTQMQSRPSWQGRVAATRSLVRELEANDAYRFRPERFRGSRPPTLLLVGGSSPPDEVAATAMLAAALPEARVVTLPGQGHVAMSSAPDLFAAEVLRFLRAGGPGEPTGFLFEPPPA